LSVRGLVTALEQSIIDYVADFDIEAIGRRDAPGVYVQGAKLAALGLRIRRGCSYHGLALNVDMDLAPYARINPCGMAGLAVTQLRDLGGPADVKLVADALGPHIVASLQRASRAAA
jgi:lipoyl(octanoyl) transferase